MNEIRQSWTRRSAARLRDVRVEKRLGSPDPTPRDFMTEDDSRSDADRLTAEVEAMALWERHLENATDRWHEGVSESAQEYREGLADALGVEPEDVPDETVEHWQESVMETGPEQFAAAITGDGTDWFTGFYEQATGERPPAEVVDLASDIEREALSEVGEDASDEEIVRAVREAVRRRTDAADGS